MAGTELSNDKGGGLKMLAHLQTLAREQCAYPQRDSCNWFNCVGCETYVAEMSEVTIVGDNGRIMILAPYPYDVVREQCAYPKWIAVIDLSCDGEGVCLKPYTTTCRVNCVDTELNKTFLQIISSSRERIAIRIALRIAKDLYLIFTVFP